MARKSDSPARIDQKKEICERLAAGESLRQICESDDFPTEAAVRGWVLDDAVFAAHYTRARGIGIDSLAERGIGVASDQKRDANCRRVELDAIKWFASKLRPDKYGDRTVIAGDKDAPLAISIAETIRTKRQNRMLAEGGKVE